LASANRYHLRWCLWIGTFSGDPATPTDLADWYAPHIKAVPEVQLMFVVNEANVDGEDSATTNV